MKKNIKELIFLMILVVPFIWSCSNDDGAEEYQITSSPIVRFENADEMIEVPEASTSIIEFPISITSATEKDVFVNYTLQGDAANFELVNGTPTGITIKKGSRLAYLQIRPVDNAVLNDPPNSLVITITGSDGQFLTPSETAEIGLTKKTIIFKDDECPLELAEFVGTYSADENNGSYGPYDVTIELNATGDALIVNNLWDVGGASTVMLDNSDPQNPVASFIDGEYLYTHSTYGEAGVYNTTDYQSTFSTCDLTLDLYFKVCVSLGCFGGFDGTNQRIQLVKK